MKASHRAIACAFAVTSVFAAAAGAQPRSDSQPSYDSVNRSMLGVVEYVDIVREGNGGSNVAGTVIGGILGGVLGHQIGSGRGNDVATVAGALGGAAVGHEISDSNGSRSVYQLRVRLDSGDYQTIRQDNPNGLRAGDRVRIQGDRAVPFSNGGERYDSRGDRDGNPAYRTDERGFRYDAEGYRVDERGRRN